MLDRGGRGAPVLEGAPEPTDGGLLRVLALVVSTGRPGVTTSDVCVVVVVIVVVVSGSIRSRMYLCGVSRTRKVLTATLRVAVQLAKTTMLNTRMRATEFMRICKSICAAPPDQFPTCCAAACSAFTSATKASIIASETAHEHISR